jgi:ABC-type sugar transport system ATPase subunit
MTNSSAAPAALVLHEIRKSFGATNALKSVSMSITAGTVHALVGENGAGKSTALGIVAGRIPPTSGRVEVFGEELKYGDPRASRKAGIVAIYQELTIIPALGVEANVFLGQDLSKAGFLSQREMRMKYTALCERVGVKAHPPRTRAGSLSVADQQVLEILRALVSEARVILFDEPTASLAISEREALFRLINSLRAEGVTIMFVSHNLDEVLELADVVTVFRDGELKVTEPRKQLTKPILVRAMIGTGGGDLVAIRELLEDDEKEAAHATADASRSVRLAQSLGRAPLLAVSGVCVPGAVDGLEVEVRAGEIVGVGGLVGSGRTTLLRAIAGLEPAAKGRMFIDGTEVAWPRTVRQALSYGIALIPEDRKGQGLVPKMTSMDNIALSDFSRVATAGFLSPASVEKGTVSIAKAFGFRQNRLRHRAAQLSGGNQQKLLLARWKFLTPRILLADEPTRGIDIGAKAEILASLEEMAHDGLGLIMVSSELEEVAVVSDRVFVLAEGAMAGTLDYSRGEVTISNILHLAFRVRETPETRTPSRSAGPVES